VRARRKLEIYGALFLFGAIVWGTADEFRYRPFWAQLLILAFWTFLAAVGVVIVADDLADKRVGEERELDRRFAAQAEAVEGRRALSSADHDQSNLTTPAEAPNDR
jgi:4-hydroxybenzoate polyprenyltransferase